MFTPRQTALRMWVVLAALLTLAPPPTDVTAQPTEAPCAALLEEAEMQYVEGAFDRAIQMASECLSAPGVTDSDKVRAHRLIVLAYLRNDDLESARLAVLELLQVDPAYEADPVLDPPPYTALVSLVRQQLLTAPLIVEETPPIAAETPPVQTTETESDPPSGPSWFQRNKLVLVTGSVLATGVVGFLLSGSGGGSGGAEPPPGGGTPLPPPPALP